MNVPNPLHCGMTVLSVRWSARVLLASALLLSCAGTRAQEGDGASATSTAGIAAQPSDLRAGDLTSPRLVRAVTSNEPQSNEMKSIAPPVLTPPIQTPSAAGSTQAATTPPRDLARAATLGPGSSSASGASPGNATGALDLRIPLPVPDRQVGETAGAVRIVLALTLLAILPSLLVCLSSFLRIVIVLSMLRHAIGMPETPPNTVVIGLALFLTLFTMNPVLQQLNNEALQPFMAGGIGVEQGVERVAKPLRQFMLRQTREQDLALMVELSKSTRPQSIDDVGNLQLIPAFMLSELRAAFQIGFVIFLPFLLIDLIVSSILMSLGMMMMPPVTLSLPIKILMFILVDGWGVLVKALVTSFH